MTPRRVASAVLRSLFPVRMAERDLRRSYFSAHGRYPNIRNPKLFTEKIQHRKLFDRDERFSICADKVLVKQYVRERLGGGILVPTLFSGRRLPPREQRTWPLPFVVKANHGSGFNIFVREKTDLDWPAIEAKVDLFLSIDFGAQYNERHYSKIARQVLVEPFLSDGGGLPPDYKIFVFGGSPDTSRSIPTASTRTSGRFSMSIGIDRLFGSPIRLMHARSAGQPRSTRCWLPRPFSAATLTSSASISTRSAGVPILAK